MTLPQTLISPPFRFDLAHRRFWHESEELFLRPKAFAMLSYLLERPGQFVTKGELLAAIWPGTSVSDGAVKACIRELRKVLGDDARTPEYIETVHRRGYRFIAPLHSASPVQGPKSQVHSPDPIPHPQSLTPIFVGREAELEQLHDWFSQAHAGARQIVFVTGEPGIGKTSLIETFLHTLRTTQDVWIAQGQCIEQYGQGEAYLPVLTALGRLCREPSTEHLVPLLHQWAPTWAVQLPWLLSDNALAALQLRLQRSTPERMLREFAEAVEVLTVERPLVLWLDDLQWSDFSTLDLLSFLAQRHERARLLIVGTYRSGDTVDSGHSVSAAAHELYLHGHCDVVPLGLLGEDDVRHHLTQHEIIGKQSATSISTLARSVHQRTEGNPLFMLNVVEEVLSQGGVEQIEQACGIGTCEEQEEQQDTYTLRVPDSLRQMIEQRLDRLDVESQHALEVASVAGLEFTAATIAIQGHRDALQTEAVCAELARRQQFVQACGICEWPDGTLTTRYRFLHALYQEVLYERLPAGRRRFLHQQIAERQERGYGQRAVEIAAELAVHFENGRTYGRAVEYRQQAAHVALQRYAYREALAHLTHGDELLQRLPVTPDRNHKELHLLLQLTEPLMLLNGGAAPEVKRTYSRALVLSQQLADPAKNTQNAENLVDNLATHCQVLLRLGTVHLVCGEILTADRYGQQAMTLAEQIQQPMFFVFAHQTLGTSALYQGRLRRALTHFENVITLADMPSPPSLVSTTHVFCLVYTSLALWALGYPEQAVRRSREGLTAADQLGLPYSQVFALYGEAVLHTFRRDVKVVQTRVQEMITLCEKYGLQEMLALGTIIDGWALAECGHATQGIARMQRGLATYQATGARLSLPHLLAMLVEASAQAEQANEGLEVLTEAVDAMQHSGEQLFAPWLLRLKGELLLALSSEQHFEAEQCFLDAIDAAQCSQAKSWELQATIRLTQLWHQQGKRKRARQRLAEIFGWFSEGGDTTDLREAKALLSAWS